MPRQLIAWLLFAAIHTAGAQQSGATLVGIVTAQEGGAPIPYADVTVDHSAAAGLTDARGMFRFGGLPPRRLLLRIRRLGYRSDTVTVALTAGKTDTVRIALSRLALRLDAIAVSDKVCPDDGHVAADTGVVSILEQVHINAERSAILAREFPFELEMQRTFSDDIRRGANLTEVRSRRVLQVDTIVTSSGHTWRYAPGQLVVSTNGDSPVGAAEKMHVPQLADFADDGFIASHCFRYAGVETLEGHEVARVDFAPTDAFEKTDVKGSLYLDATSYEMRKSTLMIERPSPTDPNVLVLDVRVDTWFHDASGGISTIDRIAQMITVRNTRTRGLVSNNATSEEQTTLAVRYLGRRPGKP
ncbi:MAG: carboxypeptidase-like regulatory domain-containing protein [bacterium]